MKFFYSTILGLTFFYLPLNAQIIINEFLTSNTTINIDKEDYYGYNDWVEIYNQGMDEVDIFNLGRWEKQNSRRKGYTYFNRYFNF